MRRFLQLFWAALAAIIFVPILGGFVSEWAKEQGWYEHPTARVDAVMTWLVNIAFHPAYLFIAGLVLGLAIGMWLDLLLRRRVFTFRRPRNLNVATASVAATLPPPQKKIFVDVSPSYLIDLYKDKTTVQGDAASAPYIGKWIKATLKVYDISDTVSYILMQSVISSEIPNQKYLVAQFPKESSEHVSLIAKDTIITIRGQIRSVDLLRVTLQNCELVETSSS